MDPFSITVGCLALINAAGKTTIAITGFLRSCREARTDLAAVNQELSGLCLLLELLKDDSAINNSSPDAQISATLQAQIQSIINNCTAVVDKINTAIDDCVNARMGAAMKWTTSTKAEVASLRMSLEAHRSSLDIALELIAVSVARATKNDTAAIRTDVVAIKQDTIYIPQILEELKELRAIVARRAAASGQEFILEQYLDGLTSYAESVWNGDDLASDCLSLASRETPIETAGDENTANANENQHEVADQVSLLSTSPNSLADNETSDAVSFESDGSIDISREPFTSESAPNRPVATTDVPASTRNDPDSRSLDPLISSDELDSIETPVWALNRLARLDHPWSSPRPPSATLSATATTAPLETSSEIGEARLSSPGEWLYPIEAAGDGTHPSTNHVKGVRKPLKMVLVGDSPIGKTSLLHLFCNGVFPEGYVSPTGAPTTYSADVEHMGNLYDLTLEDTSGLDDYDRLRPISYPDSDVIIVGFSIGNPDSIDNIIEKWMPEVRYFCENVPCILVGTRRDLRHDPHWLEELNKTSAKPVSYQEGKSFAKEIGANAYTECSAKENAGVQEVFAAAITAAIDVAAFRAVRLDVPSRSRKLRLLGRNMFFSGRNSK